MKTINIIKYYFIAFSFILFLSCKKDKSKFVTIKGHAFNAQLGIPLKNHKVYLNTRYEPKSKRERNRVGVERTNISVTTDNNGFFKFENFEMHSSSEYFYLLSISDGQSYCQGYYCDGYVTSLVEFNNILEDYALSLPLSFSRFTVTLDDSCPLNYPDTISILLRQELSTQPSFTMTSNCLRNGNNCFIDEQPIGKWFLNISKTKNNVNTNYIDSVTLTIGQIQTYTLMY